MRRNVRIVQIKIHAEYFNYKEIQINITSLELKTMYGLSNIQLIRNFHNRNSFKLMKL